MRVTLQMVDWLAMKMQEGNLSFAELARRSGMSWQNWQRLIHHVTQETSADTDEAICRVFGITIEQLRDIADGKKRTGTAKHDGISRKAESLWRWLNHDPLRCSALRAMGYKGDLPK